MRAFGKLFGSWQLEDGELAWVEKELVKYCVEYTVQPKGDEFVVLWFDPIQVPRLPYHLGVFDKLIPSYNETLPLYSQVYFHRVDDLLLGE